MAAIIKRCYICDYEYDEEQKRPLMLDCGHSFCLSCLQQIKAIGEATCPTCRRCWEEKNIEELPLCYQLLPEEPEGVAKLCTDHKSQVLFWCETCKCRLCRKCLREKHRRCEWILLEERLDPMKEDFMKKAEEISTRLNESLEKIGKTTAENKAVLDLIKDLKKVLGPSEVQFAAYQQQILLLRVKVSKEVVTLEKLREDWNIPPGSDYMSTLQSKTKALEEIQKVLWWPQQPNWGFLGRIVDNFQRNRTREMTLAEICEGAALPLSDDESGFDGQDDDDEDEEEDEGEEEVNEEQQQMEDDDDEEEDEVNSVRENPAATAAATSTASNVVQTNDGSAGASAFSFTHDAGAQMFAAGTSSAAATTASNAVQTNDSARTSAFAFTYPQHGIFGPPASSGLSFGSAPSGSSVFSSEIPTSVPQPNTPQTSVFSFRRATQGLPTSNPMFVFRRTLQPSPNTVPSSTTFSFGAPPQPPATSAPSSSGFSFGAAIHPPATTAPSSSALSFGAVPQPPATAAPPSSGLSFGAATHPPATTAPSSSGLLFGAATHPPATTAPSSSALSFGAVPQPPATTVPPSSGLSFGASTHPPATTAPSSSGLSFGAATHPPATTAPSSSALSFGAVPQPPVTTAPPSSGFSFGAATHPPATTAPSSSALSFGAAPQPPATTAPLGSGFSFGAAPQPPVTTAPSSSALSLGAAPQLPATTAPPSSALSFGTNPQPPATTAQPSSALSFGAAPQPPAATVMSSSAFSFGAVSQPPVATALSSSAFSLGAVPQPPSATALPGSGFSFGIFSQPPAATAPSSSAFSFGSFPQPPATTVPSNYAAINPFSTGVSFPVTSVPPIVRAFRFGAPVQVPTADEATTTGAFVITASTPRETTSPTTTRQAPAATVFTTASSTQTVVTTASARPLLAGTAFSRAQTVIAGTGSSAGISAIASLPVTSATSAETSATAAAVPRTTTATLTLPSVAASTAGFSPSELFSLAASGINTVTLVPSTTLQTTATFDNVGTVTATAPSGNSAAFVFSSASQIQTSAPTTQISVLTRQTISTAVQTTDSVIQTPSATITQNSGITVEVSASTSVPANPTATLLVTATGALVATEEGTTPSSQTSGLTSSTTEVLTIPTEIGPETMLPTEPTDDVEPVNHTAGNNDAPGRPVLAQNSTVEVSQSSNVVESDTESARAVRNVSGHLDLTDAVADALRQLPERPPSSNMTLAAFQFAEGIRQEKSRTVSGDASAHVEDALEQLKKLQRIHTPGRSPTYRSNIFGEEFPPSITTNTNTETIVAGATAAATITENAAVTTNVETASIGTTVVSTPAGVSLPAMNLSLTMPTFSFISEPIPTPFVSGYTPVAAFATPAVSRASSGEVASVPVETVRIPAETAITPAETGEAVTPLGNSDLEANVVPVAPNELTAQEPVRDSTTAAAMIVPEGDNREADEAVINRIGYVFGCNSNSDSAETATAVRTSSAQLLGENLTSIFQAAVTTVTGGSEATGLAAGAGGLQGSPALNSGFTLGAPGAASVRPKQPAPQATGVCASTSSLFGETFPDLSLSLGTEPPTRPEGDPLHQAEPRVVLRRGGPFLKRPSRMRRKPRDKS